MTDTTIHCQNNHTPLNPAFTSALGAWIYKKSVPALNSHHPTPKDLGSFTLIHHDLISPSCQAQVNEALCVHFINSLIILTFFPYRII